MAMGCNYSHGHGTANAFEIEAIRNTISGLPLRMAHAMQHWSVHAISALRYLTDVFSTPNYANESRSRYLVRLKSPSFMCRVQ